MFLGKIENKIVRVIEIYLLGSLVRYYIQIIKYKNNFILPADRCPPLI